MLLVNDVRRVQRVLSTASLVLFASCFPQGDVLQGRADPLRCDESFDDHTHRGPIDPATFEAFTESPAGEQPQRVSFIVAWVTDDERRQVRFEDGRFYQWHDQWFWFRLMNGVSACGSSADPVMGARFDSIQALEDAFRNVPDAQLPLDLTRVAGGRYYSPGFYELALHVKPRVYGPGTLFRRVEAGRDDRWFFELEFVDQVTRDDLEKMHATIEATLPAGSRLFWRAVSAAQSSLGDTLQHSDGLLRERVLRLGEEPP